MVLNVTKCQRHLAEAFSSLAAGLRQRHLFSFFTQVVTVLRRTLTKVILVGAAVAFRQSCIGHPFPRIAGRGQTGLSKLEVSSTIYCTSGVAQGYEVDKGSKKEKFCQRGYTVGISWLRRRRRGFGFRGIGERRLGAEEGT